MQNAGLKRTVLVSRHGSANQSREPFPRDTSDIGTMIIA